MREDFLEPRRLAQLFSQRNIFRFQLLAQLANLFVGQRIRRGDRERARDILQDGELRGGNARCLSRMNAATPSTCPRMTNGTAA